MHESIKVLYNYYKLLNGIIKCLKITECKRRKIKHNTNMVALLKRHLPRDIYTATSFWLLSASYFQSI